MAEHVVALRNPVASHAEALGWRLDELQRGCENQASFTMLTTSPDAAETRAMLYESVPPDSVLVVASGDGTLSQTADNLANRHPGKPGHLASTPLLAFGTGNKNDVAKMLSGTYSTNPLHVLRRGNTVRVPLLETVFEQDGEITERQLALYSLGFGAIGRGARMANDPTFRAAQRDRCAAARHAAEYDLGFRAYLRTPEQSITVNGEQRRALSVVVSNGDRMAGRWRLPAQLPEAAFFMGFVRSKNPVLALRDTVGLFTNTLPDGGLHRESVQLGFSAPTIGEIDGEDRDIMPGSLTIGLGPSVAFVSTRYAAQTANREIGFGHIAL